ncbi:unnamed protein product [Colletotrichum noveboracense]|uniref:Protein kinase domain-containing protein n=1 Tax=Colletotrichum noveboracense TaxID=2664923 RepID=A0A9W4S469_9PEZI|nr:hypothetical protein K456DRAFT_1718959 [Colletotrichum gloeosporioides 23]KAJ0315636.1 hypothetical protein Brms1b_005916 [Colletotrichum noveboracense]CAI0652147.1 unnamed protein product [Colletotrichum noveboracense]
MDPGEIMDPHEDFIRPTDEYAVGKEFNLFPYKPDEPHGTEVYRRRRLPADEIVGSIRGFDPTKDFTNTKARVRIDEHIRISMNQKSQIFGLSIVKAPIDERPASEQQSLYHPVGSGQPITWNLVGKAVDVEYASSDSVGVKQIEEAADGRVCCEHAAYTYYRSLGKTGYPHVMPQFYGTWVMEIDDGFDDEGIQVNRYVCVLLLEYIHGYSIDELSYRSEEDEGYFGKLAGFQRVDNTWTNVWMDESTRALVIKKMLHGVVVGMHHGVQHHEASPENVFMTLRDGTNNTDLDELRVVLLDHTSTQIWRKTVDSHFYGRTHCLEKLPYPIHPKQGCSVMPLEDYVGWWPPAPEDRPGEDLNEMFDDWMLSEDVFGPLVEARDVEAGLQGKEWPHKYAKYSTFDTLDIIEAQEPQEMRKKAMRKVIIPKVLSYWRMMKDEGRAELEDRHKICEESDDESFEDSSSSLEEYTRHLQGRNEFLEQHIKSLEERNEALEKRNRLLEEKLEALSSEESSASLQCSSSNSQPPRNQQPQPEQIPRRPAEPSFSPKALYDEYLSSIGIDSSKHPFTPPSSSPSPLQDEASLQGSSRFGESPSPPSAIRRGGSRSKKSVQWQDMEGEVEVEKETDGLIQCEQVPTAD